MNNGETPSVAEPVVEIPRDRDYQSPSAFPGVFEPVHPNNPPWGVLAAFVTWFISIVFLVFVPVITAVPYVLYAAQRGTSSPDALLTDKNFIFFSVAGVIPAHLLTLGVAWAVVTKFGRYPFWKTLGWQWPRNFGPWKSVGVALALLGIGALITYVVGGKQTELDELINSSYRTRITTAILAATTGPLVEEIVYRGLLYPAFERALGVVSSVLIVSTLFAGVHVYQYRSNIGVIAVISILSLSLTVIRAYTGSLLPSFFIHFVFNGVQSVLLLLQPLMERTQQALPSKAPGLLVAGFLRLFL